MTGCQCNQCRDLYAELDDEQLFEHYRHKLLVRGWGGVLTTAERAYVRAHRSEAARRAALASAARAKTRGFAASPAPTGAVTAETGYGATPATDARMGVASAKARGAKQATR